MSASVLSASWYRVARLRPRIRGHARFHRHRYRGRIWYVLQDPTTGRCHRLSPSAYQVAGLMDGVRTAQEIWEIASARLGDDAPTQDETIRLLGLLHGADVLQCDVPPDTAEILRRSQRRERSSWWQRFANPLAVRIPLVDPDAFLERWLPLARPLFTRTSAVVVALLVLTAALLAASHAEQLTADAATRLLAPRNLFLLWLVYPVLKGLHELGHAFATKVWGGEVHEMGIVFLVLVPIPYVDASAASAFPNKRHRVVVGAAGILVELVLAALACLLWLAVEPGLVRAVAWNVMWIGVASSLLFNGNPLLRFDGYYVLADAAELPNLYQRANQYLAWLVLHHVFRLDNVRDPVSAPGEARWFLVYGVAAFLYRFFILFVIALFLAERFFVLGVLLAVAAVALQVALPLARQIHFLLASPRLGTRRARAVGLSAAGAAVLAALVLAVPIPHATRAEGVVWPAEGTQVRAGADGFVQRLLVEPGARVAAGVPLVLTRDPEVETRVAVEEAALRALRARHHAERRHDRVQAQITAEEIATAEAALARAREQMGDVVVRSPAQGTFVLTRAEDLVGRFVRHGELLGYVVADVVPTARVVVPQQDAALVRDRTRRVEVRQAGRLDAPLAGEIERQVPAASDRLPSAALGSQGGGPFVVDAEDPDGLRTLETVFQLDVRLPQASPATMIGSRVYVRFDHGGEPVAARLWSATRRLFLRRLGV